MDENAITDLLLDCLRGLTAMGQRRFIARALGVGAISRDVPMLEVYGRVRWLDGRKHGAGPKHPEPRAVVVSVTGDGVIDDRDPKTSPGSEVDGVLLWRDDLVVLLEFKLAGNPVSRNQLARHADTWGIPTTGLQAWTDVEDPPSGFGFSSWKAVRAAVNELIGSGSLPPEDRDRLARLRDELELVSSRLAGSGQPEQPARAFPVPITPLPAPVDLVRLLVDVDLREVRSCCKRLYGPRGAAEVEGDTACVNDALRLIDDYEFAGLAAPPGLSETDKKGRKHNIMTPGRMLTCAYQGKFQPMLGGDARTLKRRLLGRGADRLTLIGLWAWATHGRPSTAKTACANALPRLWAGAEPRPIAAPDLAAALGIDPGVLMRERP